MQTILLTMHMDQRLFAVFVMLFNLLMSIQGHQISMNRSRQSKQGALGKYLEFISDKLKNIHLNQPRYCKR